MKVPFRILSSWFLLMFLAAEPVMAQKTIYVVNSGDNDTCKTKQEAFQKYLKYADYEGKDKSSQNSGLAVTTHVVTLIEPGHAFSDEMAWSAAVKRTAKHEDGSTTIDEWVDTDVIKAITKTDEKEKHDEQLSDTVAHSLAPLGRGHTGRFEPANHCEELAMREAMADPAAGTVIMQSMGDTRWKGWKKMEMKHTCADKTKVLIHYVGNFENGVLKQVDDFKFKEN